MSGAGAAGDILADDTPTPAPDTADTTPGPAPGQLPEGLVGDMPDVQEHVVQAIEEDERKVEEATEAAKAERDASGNVFDPGRHATDDKGRPLKTPTGRWKKIPGGASKGVKGKLGSPGPAQATPVEDPTAKARAAGAMLANTIMTACTVGIGDEWEPTEGERAGMEQAYGDLAVASGLEDVPPGLAAIVVTGMYVVPRLRKPKTKTWLQARWEAAKAWAQKRKAERAKREVDKTPGEVDE